jgi:hypothetical protein
MEKRGDDLNAPGVKRVEIGWGKTKDGRNIVFVRPTAQSPDIQMVPFALPEDDARRMFAQLGQILEQIDAYRKPS